MSIVLTELNIYPIKSCAGIALKSAEVTERGFLYDRLWMLVDENNQFITQRTKPKMALIKPALVDFHSKKKVMDELGKECANISFGGNGLVDIELVLHAPDMPPITLRPHEENNLRMVTIWRDVCQAIDEGDEIADWLSTYLKSKCRLVRFDQRTMRLVDPQYARSKNDQVGFPDGYPFLLISEGSLLDLNERLVEPVPMNRFRPNLVVNGCVGFAEDSWQVVRIGKIEFDLVKPCSRCVITTTDQSTAKVSAEPLRTLSKYRSRNNKVMFGQNLIHRQKGRLSLGDELEVIN